MIYRAIKQSSIICVNGMRVAAAGSYAIKNI